MAEEEKAISKVGGDRIETHRPGHGTPGAIASNEARSKRRRKREETMRAKLLKSFDEIQEINEGAHAITKWAIRNNSTLSDYYTKLIARLIPTEVSGSDDNPIVIKIQRL